MLLRNHRPSETDWSEGHNERSCQLQTALERFGQFC